MVLRLAEGLLSPAQKALVTSLPRIVENRYSLLNRPLPRFSFMRKGARLAIVYEFENEQDAIDYQNAETETLHLLEVLLAESKKRNDTESENPRV